MAKDKPINMNTEYVCAICDKPIARAWHGKEIRFWLGCYDFLPICRFGATDGVDVLTWYDMERLLKMLKEVGDAD